MKHKDGTYDLTVDDIHEIRKEHSKMTENMSAEELKEYYDEEEKKFNDKLEEVKSKKLQTA